LNQTSCDLTEIV